MVRRLKWIGYFTLVLFAVLFGSVVWSKSVNAIGSSIILTNPEYVGNFNGGVCQMTQDSNLWNQSINNSGYCTTNDAMFLKRYYVKGIMSQPFNNINRDKYYSFNITVAQRYTGSLIWTLPPTVGGWNIVDIDLEYELSMEEFCSKFNNIYDNGVYRGILCESNSNQNLRIARYNFLMKVADGKNPNYFGLGNPDIPALQNPTNIFIGSTPLSADIYLMSDIWSYDIADSTSSYLETQKQEDEGQGQQSQGDSDQAGQNVEGATTNLLSAITGFFGAFTSASATTCQTDWGIEGFRNFDFCATQVPTELRIVFTIVASIIFIPMIWFLITSILNAFKEFQQ